MLCALALPATAADLPISREPMPTARAFTWTGVYLGVQAGYGWGTDVTNEYLTNPFVYVGLTHPFKTSGYTFGSHMGANYQFGSIVVGLEADAEWSNYRGGFADPAVPPFNPGGFGRTRLDTQGSVRARLGYSFDRVMIYATGGFAGGQMRTTYTTWATNVSENFSKFATGYALGGGIEYAVTDNVTIRGEYRYTDFGNAKYDSTIAFPGFSATQRPRYNTMRLGASYKF